jgi:N-acetylmuramic acid 6-phosphate (MurNAc-6-P) etherase
MATDAEQRYLAVMAASGETPYRSAEIAHQFGAKDQRVSVHRDSLIQKSLVYLAADSSTTLCRFCRVPA